MKNPNKWYSRRRMGLAAAVLILIGTWAAIVLLPTIFLALTLFILIGGSGLFIACKQKRLLETVGVTSLVPAWAYLLILLFTNISGALLGDLLIAFVPLLVSLILALFWAVLRKLAPNNKTLPIAKRPVLLAFFTLLVVVPFVVGVPLDYNERADISPHEATGAKIVDKYLGGPDEDNFVMTFETVEEGLRFSYIFWWDWRFYDEHEIGDFCQIIVRQGALGYPWMERYVD